MIRIITGHSAQGGSTVAFINLTNALNDIGIDTILLGPHDWHLNKCKAEKLTERKLQISPNDTLIFHFWRLEHRPPVKKVLLSCHEQNVFPLQNINYKIYDKIHFVSETQRQYHNIIHPYFIIPNILDDLIKTPLSEKKVVGIIGSIDRNKQVHISIQRALKDGFTDIRIFGMITDRPYWEQEVKNLVDGINVKYIGFLDDKQKIYDQITEVYHSSILETWGYIKAECELTGRTFHGNSSSNNAKITNKNDIIDMWKKELIL